MMKRETQRERKRVATVRLKSIDIILLWYSTNRFRFDDNIRQHLKLPSAVATRAQPHHPCWSNSLSLSPSPHPLRCTECPFELSRLPLIDKYCTGMWQLACLPARRVALSPSAVWERFGFFSFCSLPLFFAPLSFFTLFLLLCDPP